MAWLLTRQQYKELEAQNRDVAAELLKVGLKLTKERMDAITSYVLPIWYPAQYYDSHYDTDMSSLLRRNMVGLNHLAS